MTTIEDIIRDGAPGNAIVPLRPTPVMIAAGARLSAISKGDGEEASILRNLNAIAIYQAMIRARPAETIMFTSEGEFAKDGDAIEAAGLIALLHAWSTNIMLECLDRDREEATVVFGGGILNLHDLDRLLSWFAVRLGLQERGLLGIGQDRENDADLPSVDDVRGILATDPPETAQSNVVQFPGPSFAATEAESARLAAFMECGPFWFSADEAAKIGTPDDWLSTAILYLKAQTSRQDFRMRGEAVVSLAALDIILGRLDDLEGEER